MSCSRRSLVTVYHRLYQGGPREAEQKLYELWHYAHPRQTLPTLSQLSGTILALNMDPAIAHIEVASRGEQTTVVYQSMSQARQEILLHASVAYGLFGQFNPLHCHQMDSVTLVLTLSGRNLPGYFFCLPCGCCT
jgi:hypothetical protein